MNLIIKNKQINGKIEDILNKIKIESYKNLFKDMKPSGDHLMVSCPFHKNGKENHPSFGILATRKDPKLPFGISHCFTCGKNVNLQGLVAYSLDLSYDEAEDWLVDNFGGDNVDEELPEIILEDPKPSPNMSEDILKLYDYYHPYMWKRKLSKEVVDRFRVGYDKSRNAITFPVWDAQGNLKFITARSVNTKRFWIPKNVDKPVYLLNFAIKDGVTSVLITESQINTLYSHSIGYYALGLFGTGSYTQYRELKRSGIRKFTLCLDGDKGGRLGTKRFIEAMKEDVLIDVVEIPEGKDLNDLSKEEFEALPILDSYSWLDKYSSKISEEQSLPNNI